MKSKLKFLIIALAMVAVTGAVLYMPLMGMAQSNGEEIQDVEFVEPCYRYRYCCKPRSPWWFLHNSYPVEIEGTAVGLWKGMLVVNTTEGHVRVHLPKMWTIGEEFVKRGELFDEYLSVGEEITVKALRANVTDKEGFSIYVLLGYEIIDECGVGAYAVLPFNVETHE